MGHLTDNTQVKTRTVPKPKFSSTFSHFLDKKFMAEHFELAFSELNLVATHYDKKPRANMAALNQVVQELRKQEKKANRLLSAANTPAQWKDASQKIRDMMDATGQKIGQLVMIDTKSEVQEIGQLPLHPESLDKAKRFLMEITEKAKDEITHISEYMEKPYFYALECIELEKRYAMDYLQDRHAQMQKLGNVISEELQKYSDDTKASGKDFSSEIQNAIFRANQNASNLRHDTGYNHMSYSDSISYGGLSFQQQRHNGLREVVRQARDIVTALKEMIESDEIDPGMKEKLLYYGKLLTQNANLAVTDYNEMNTLTAFKESEKSENLESIGTGTAFTEPIQPPADAVSFPAETFRPFRAAVNDLEKDLKKYSASDFAVKDKALKAKLPTIEDDDLKALQNTIDALNDQIAYYETKLGAGVTTQQDVADVLRGFLAVRRDAETLGNKAAVIAVAHANAHGEHPTADFVKTAHRFIEDFDDTILPQMQEQFPDACKMLESEIAATLQPRQELKEKERLAQEASRLPWEKYLKQEREAEQKQEDLRKAKAARINRLVTRPKDALEDNPPAPRPQTGLTAPQVVEKLASGQDPLVQMQALFGRMAALGEAWQKSEDPAVQQAGLNLAEAAARRNGSLNDIRLPQLGTGDNAAEQLSSYGMVANSVLYPALNSAIKNMQNAIAENPNAAMIDEAATLGKDLVGLRTQVLEDVALICSVADVLGAKRQETMPRDPFDNLALGNKLARQLSFTAADRAQVTSVLGGLQNQLNAMPELLEQNPAMKQLVASAHGINGSFYEGIGFSSHNIPAPSDSEKLRVSLGDHTLWLDSFEPGNVVQALDRALQSNPPEALLPLLNSARKLMSDAQQKVNADRTLLNDALDPGAQRQVETSAPEVPAQPEKTEQQSVETEVKEPETMETEVNESEPQENEDVLEANEDENELLDEKSVSSDEQPEVTDNTSAGIEETNESQVVHEDPKEPEAPQQEQPVEMKVETFAFGKDELEQLRQLSGDLKEIIAQVEKDSPNTAAALGFGTVAAENAKLEKIFDDSKVTKMLAADARGKNADLPASRRSMGSVQSTVFALDDAISNALKNCYDSALQEKLVTLGNKLVQLENKSVTDLNALRNATKKPVENVVNESLNSTVFKNKDIPAFRADAFHPKYTAQQHKALTEKFISAVNKLSELNPGMETPFVSIKETGTDVVERMSSFFENPPQNMQDLANRHVAAKTLSGLQNALLLAVSYTRNGLESPDLNLQAEAADAYHALQEVCDGLNEAIADGNQITKDLLKTGAYIRPLPKLDDLPNQKELLERAAHLPEIREAEQKMKEQNKAIDEATNQWANELAEKKYDSGQILVAAQTVFAMDQLARGLADPHTPDAKLDDLIANAAVAASKWSTYQKDNYWGNLNDPDMLKHLSDKDVQKAHADEFKSSDMMKHFKAEILKKNPAELMKNREVGMMELMSNAFTASKKATQPTESTAPKKPAAAANDKPQVKGGSALH